MRDRWNDEEAAINLTPLVDVIFVVLIGFILVAPLLQTEEVLLAPASPVEQLQSITEGPIALLIDEKGKYRLNGVAVREAELVASLEDLHMLHPSSVPKVFQDERASFGSYQRAKNALQVAGFPQMDLVVGPAK